MYSVTLKKSAEKELDSIPQKFQGKIIESLLNLKENPRPIGTKKLKGTDGFRIRVGKFRVLYTVDDHNKIVEVFSVGDRKNIYRRF